MQIATLIFSKNRAAQLDLLLRSMKENMLNDTEITVIYTTTSRSSEMGYIKLKSKFPEVHFTREHFGIVEHIKTYINNQKLPYTLLMCDDEVMYRPCDLTTFLPHMDGIASVSLRLGKNIDNCFAVNKPQSLPDSAVEIAPGIYKWVWGMGIYDFNYPFSLTDAMYDSKYLAECISKVQFHSVNTLEQALHANKSHLAFSRMHMLCPELSVFYSLPYNLVQNEFNNRITYNSLTIDEANIHFNNGEQLHILQEEVTQCHQDFPYTWKTPDDIDAISEKIISRFNDAFVTLSDK